MKTGTIRRCGRDCATASATGRGRSAAIVLGALLIALAVQGCSTRSERHRQEDRRRIRLVLQITVDQLRPDLALQSRERWSKHGLRRLYDHGVVFSDAHHAHANTETIVGHATLASGSDPSVHGLIGNAWFDRGTSDIRYNIEDSRYAIVGDYAAAKGAAGHPEVRKQVRGRSPDSLLVPTIADSISKAGGGRAKVFAVSLKDRAAVPMAGRTGKALWWLDATGEFISSAYYYPDRKLPPWALAWNDAGPADRYDAHSWTLLHDRESYRAAQRDDMPWEVPPKGVGRTFPHRFDRKALGSGFYAAIAASPFGDDLLLEFARALLAGEDIGRDDVVDYVSVAFSSADFIGHRFGPSSLEYEDEILHLDGAIASLLRAADEAAGEGRTLVVLSSDHGIAEVPEALIAEGKSAGHVSLSTIAAGDNIRRLDAKYGGKLVRYLWPPYLYLDVDGLRARGFEPETVARELAAEIAKAPGIEAAYTRGQITGSTLLETDIARAVRKNFHPQRSGDIHVIPKRGWQLAYEGKTPEKFATGHGTPWPYDTHVPVVIAGPGIRHAVVKRRVETTDVAPTIAALTGVEPPADSSGKVLTEVLR